MKTTKNIHNLFLESNQDKNNQLRCKYY